MSGLTGVYRLDGRPVDAALLGRVTDLLARRGPDDRGCWVSGPVGLGHRMCRTTPESAGEKQPLLDETGTLCLTLDGRVDNRDELAAALRTGGMHLRTDTDAEIVLRAYNLLGDACAGRIVGDFALVIWDGRRRRLFCARDPLGIRSFYYHADARAVVWSSELRHLVDATGRPPRPNEAVIGEYLSHRLVDLEETLYRDVRRLPPGHILTVEDGRLRTARYFDVDPRREIRYRRDEEYAEHFRTILREATRCRLRTLGPAALFLSGGLDSSSLAGMVAHLMEAGAVDRGGVEAYALDFSHPAADERSYVDDVASLRGIPIRRVAAERARPRSLAAEARELRDFPDLPTMHPWNLLYDEMERRGSRVAIWGYGGDEWLTGTPLHCADLLRGLRLFALVRQVARDARTWTRLGGPPVGLIQALGWCVVPLIPPRIKRLVRRAGALDVPRWIRPEFARRVGLRERLAARPVDPPFPTIAQRAIHRQLWSGWSAAEYEMLDRYEGRRAMESRYPFNDRRLIEFALALPEEQRWRGSETKFILRRAVPDLMPASVVRRPTKGDFSYLFEESIEREGGASALARLSLVSEGMLDAGRIRAMYRKLHSGDTRYLGPMWMILATESWYRTMFAGSRTTEPPEEAP